MALKNLVRLSKTKLRSMNVASKFSYTFKRIYIYSFVAIGLLLITSIVAFYGASQLYNKSYQENTAQGMLRINNQKFAKAVWWALVTRDEDTRKEQVEVFNETTIHELDSWLNKLENLSDSDLIPKIKENVAKLDKDSTELEKLFSKGKPLPDGNISNGQDIYDFMVNNVVPANLELVEQTTALTEEVGNGADTLFSVIRILLIVMIAVSLILVLLAVLFMTDAKKKLTASVVEPVEEVLEATGKMANGDFDIDINYQADDELGKLAKDLQNMTVTSKGIVTDIKQSLLGIAGGDFTVGTNDPSKYLGEYGEISNSMNNISDKLSETINDVKEATSQVSQGAANMSQGATDLAEGATDQAAAVEELTASIATVTEHTHALAETAEKGVQMSLEAQEESKISAEKMDGVIQAMNSITEASKEIEEVANTIESIASQTQLLALNASIEAARAGEAGKGFAVVAEEISELAQQSNDAVQNTHQLVNTALSEIENGNKVVKDTQQSLLNVEGVVNQVADMIRQSGSMAKEQEASMTEISDGIEMISNVIQNNSATAQESSAVSQELSDQSSSLNDLVSQFQVK